MNTRGIFVVGVGTLVVVLQGGCAASSIQSEASTDQGPSVDRPPSVLTATDAQWMSELDNIAFGLGTWDWRDFQSADRERSPSKERSPSEDCSAYLRNANLVPIDLYSTYEERLAWYEANAIPIYNDRSPDSDVVSRQTWDVVDWLRVNPDGYSLSPDQEPARTPDTDPN